jgi:hypothetical protein
MAAEPYLSVVVAARNDDHGGNFLRRIQIFVAGWIAQSQRHGLSSELIVVEWNPPPDKPRLSEVLQWPPDFGPCEVRFVEVPPELHQRYAHADALPLYQMIAKNVGIRRARGQFVLATNIDILFSDELMAFLARKELEQGRMYRIDRLDVMSDVPVEAGIDNQLAYCRSHLLRVNSREGTFPLTPDGRRTLTKRDIAAPDSGLRFGAGWFPVEQHSDKELFRWADNNAEIDLVLPEVPRPVLRLELEPGPGMGQLPLYMTVLEGNRLIEAGPIEDRSELEIAFPPGPPERRLILRVRHGGKTVPHDPRVLNFRVFSCTWERSLRATRLPRQSPSSPSSPGSSITVRVEAIPVGLTKRLAVLWRQLQALIARISESGPLMTVTVPVSIPLKRAAAYYVERGGISGMLRNGFKSKQSRPLSKTPTAPTDAETDIHELAAPPATGPVSRLHTTPVSHLHTNGCGDFTLAAREHWFDLRAYPELDLFSMNIDSIFCYAAHHGGAVEHILSEPMRIYHIEHATGSGWTQEGQEQLFARIAAKGLTFVSYSDIIGWAAQMSRLKATMIFNRDNWGLAEFNLTETQPLGAESNLSRTQGSSETAGA